MADNIKWIKIVTNIFDDEKMKLIDAMPDNDAILVIWFKLLVQAGKSNHLGALCLNENIPYTEEMLATVFNRKIQVVRLALQTFENLGMIERSDVIQIANWEKHQNIDGMDKIRLQNKVRKQNQREREKVVQISEKSVSRDSHVTVTQCHATEGELDIDKDIEQRYKKEEGEYLVTSISEEAPPTPSVPTLEEIIAYAKSINKTAFAILSAKKFFAYFETKDWKKSGGDSVLERGWKKEFDYWLAKDEKDRMDKKPSKPDVDVPWLEDYLAKL